MRLQLFCGFHQELSNVVSSFKFWRRQSVAMQCLKVWQAVLEHPEKTLSEIVYSVYAQTGSEFPLASIFYYLQRNHFSRKKVCLIFSSALEISYSFWNKQAAAFFFPNQLNKIALQRSEDARVVFRSNVCALDSEMFVFIDESGFVSINKILIWQRFVS